MSKPQVVIIGAGAAGVFTCHALSSVGGFDVTLIESLDRVGGNAHSVPIPGTGNVVDVGPQFFSALAQPTYSAALTELGLDADIVTSSAGVTVYNSTTGPVRFHVPPTLGGILEQVLTKPGALQDWLDFSIATLSAILYDFTCKDQTQTVEEWLAQAPQSGLPEEFKQNVLIPFLYQFIVVNPNQIATSSAYFTLTYFAISVVESIIDIAAAIVDNLARHVPLATLVKNICALPLFNVHNSLIGLDGIMTKVLEKSGVTPLLGQPVTGLTRQGTQWQVQTSSNHYLADAVVFACHPDAAAGILNAWASVERPALLTTLRQFPYVEFPINMQTPPTCYLPPGGPVEAVNIMTTAECYQFTVSFAQLRPDLQNWNAFKSWGNPKMTPATCGSTFHATQRFGVLPSVPFMQAQQALETFQGTDGLWFAGGYTNWYDSQESAVRSANRVAQGLTGAGAAVDSQPDRKALFARAVRALQTIDQDLLPHLDLAAAVPAAKASVYRSLLNELAAAAGTA